MSSEKIYKYAILRNREGEYVIPYSGVHGLADVAFTGKYSDLIDTPDDANSYLPAIIDKTGASVKYLINNKTELNEAELLLNYDLNHLVDEGTDFEDLSNDVIAVNSQYVHNVAHYLVDKLQEQIDIAIEVAGQEEEPPVDPYSGVTKTYKGMVADMNALNADGIISSVQNGDYYFVESEQKYLMYFSGNWVEII